jgi:hypothetical protein
LSIRRFCELTSLSRVAVYHLRKSGRLHTVSVGRRQLISYNEAERFVREGA